MTAVAQALEQVRSSLLDGLRFDDPARWSDDELLAATASIEAVGRVIDAHRAACAGEVAERSRVELGGERLSARRGCRSVSELIERVTQVSGAEARRRITLGAATRGRVGLTGEPLEAEFPGVATALADGVLGADAATTIVRELDRPRRIADPVTFAAAERELVAAATGTGGGDDGSGVGDGSGGRVRRAADELRVQAQAWAAFLDQDGPEPDDDHAMLRRGVRLGRARDGLIPIRGDLMPEVAAGLTRLFDAHLSPRSSTGFVTDEEAAHFDVSGEQRTTDQQRHDVLAAIIETAARSGAHPSLGGAPPTVLVSVRASDLAAGRGAGHADGVETPISLRAVRQLMCTGGTQRVGFDDRGRIIELGSPERCFTPQQRRAITVRDGGCLIPGCSVPASWCEIHHVIPDIDGGPTHPDNGVLVCWFHHRTIETSGWGIRMQHGVPQIRPPVWLDPGGGWRDATKSPTRIADQLERRPDPAA
ncbi:HNH endonuclease signature motif containing protein [Agromyces humatus]|uniref:HNH endonuclease signature motif containing protein n=1 Tax=Agromyces humatus TaxID=279573 RepID=A0ABP4WRK4_9MICO|nr:HNH endonuclease signature motif containing protein [Agromyces humatus]